MTLTTPQEAWVVGKMEAGLGIHIQVGGSTGGVFSPHSCDIVVLGGVVCAEVRMLCLCD